MSKSTDGEATLPELSACVWGIEGADQQHIQCERPAMHRTVGVPCTMK